MPSQPKKTEPARTTRDISLEFKRRHVVRAKQTRDHHCHWPGCQEQVAPARWGCYRHWMTIPKALRCKLWGAYRPEQEDTMTPSREYVVVAREIQQWIRDNYVVDTLSVVTNKEVAGDE